MSISAKPAVRIAAILSSGLFLLGAGVQPSASEEMSGVLRVHITPTDGRAFTTESGVVRQLWKRHGVALDGGGKFAAFYEDVIAYRIESGVLHYESHGRYIFPDDKPDDDVSNTVLLHTSGTLTLATGEWLWEVSEFTGGTGQYANLQSTPRSNWTNDFGGPGGGCMNPPNDPQGFPNIVVCEMVVDWTY